MRDDDCEDLAEFERILMQVASRCEPQHGASGRVGFLYRSAKDQTKWHRLTVKRWVGWMMAVGRLVSLDDIQWGKVKRSTTKKTTPDVIASMLIAAFGNGKDR